MLDILFFSITAILAFIAREYFFRKGNVKVTGILSIVVYLEAGSFLNKMLKVLFGIDYFSVLVLCWLVTMLLDSIYVRKRMKKSK